MVKTITDLPNNFENQVKATINNREFEVVARNVILLLLALNTENVRAAADTSEMWDIAESLIHLWYSAFISTNVLSRLHTQVKPLIEDVCNRVAEKAANVILGKTWRFTSGNTLRLVLRKQEWFSLRGFLDVPDGLTQEEAGGIRAATTLAPERVDYRDRWYFKDQTLFMRIAKQRFREDGLLLHFGHPRAGFSIPKSVSLV